MQPLQACPIELNNQAKAGANSQSQYTGKRLPNRRPFLWLKSSRYRLELGGAA